MSFPIRRKTTRKVYFWRYYQLVMPDSPEIYWHFSDQLRPWIDSGDCDIVWTMAKDGDKFYLDVTDDAWGDIQGVLADVADRLGYDLSF